MQLDIRNPLVRGFFSTFKKPTRLTVTEWANEFRILPSKGSAAPGKYRSERTPYMVQPMDDLSVSSQVEEVVIVAAAQTGKSESGNNWVGYVIDNAPGPMLLVQPTVDGAKRYSKQRIGPMIAESPTLAAKVIENKSREGGNTMLEKEFPNGILLMGGANSAAGLRSMPIRFFFGDEISNWPADVDGEGDPLELALERTNSFGRKRKVLLTSTPGNKGACRITDWYLKTDQRKYHVPCPHCGTLQVLAWGNFVIPKDDEGRYLPAKAYMRCAEDECAQPILESHKTDLLRNGVWIATCPEKTDTTRAGYQISALYSPPGWKSWAKIARQWLEAQGNPSKLKAFTNNVLAEAYQSDGSSVDHTGLMARREAYGLDALPEGVLLITIGADVQPNRIELEVIGWGLGEESWSLDYQVFMGDPNAPLVWQQLDLFLAREYAHPFGVRLRAARTFIDTRGQNTKAVYDYVRDREFMGVFGIMGEGGDGKPAVGNPRKSNYGKVPLFPLGTFVLKDLHYGRLAIQKPEDWQAGMSLPGFCHFPERYEEAYFKGLTSEEVKFKTDKKGFTVREWHKKTDKARNEPLDCRNYGTAAMLSMNINWDQLAEIIANQAMPESPHRRVRGEMVPSA
jgi:phage terminase large subunit GpA-like protein